MIHGVWWSIYFISARQNEEKLKQASIDRCSDTLSKRLLAEVLQEEIDDVAEEVFESDVTARLEEMAQNARAVERMIQAKYLRKWKNKYAGAWICTHWNCHCAKHA